MRRIVILLAIFAALIAAQIAYNRMRLDRWRALPGGGKIRFVAVTYDKYGKIKTESSIFEPLRDRLGPRCNGLLGPRPLNLGFPLSAPGLQIVFLVQNADNDLPHPESFTLELDGESQHFDGFSGIRVWDQKAIAIAFKSATPALPRLHIRWSKEREGAVDFDIPNPFYQPPSAPNITPKPSPPKP
jgi:hypothetical protein